MFTRHIDTAPKRRREKLTSICLLTRGDVADDKLAVTWVDVASGGRQIPHNHPEVQVYVIVAGRGRMLVGEEQKEVSAGELVYVPSGVMHGIENIGEDTLSYISAANPAFDYIEAYDRGQLVGESYPKNEGEPGQPLEPSPAGAFRFVSRLTAVLPGRARNVGSRRNFITSMRLIRYRPEHRELMLALHRRAIEGFSLGMSQQDDEADLMAVEEVYLRTGGEFLIGFVNEQLVAMGGFKKLSDTSAELRRMRIEQELQGRGLGTQLLRELERMAFQAGIRTLCLDTARRRPLTLEFYRKHGYQETGRGFYGEVETVQFSKTLDE
jgi:mannose-6-phosphate isomerase-like protein (cupin superfamily)/GNAT superfamily N-acetyltransferase